MGERGGHSDPDITVGGPVSNFFLPFGPQFGLKVRGEGRPLPWIREGIASRHLHKPKKCNRELAGQNSTFKHNLIWIILRSILTSGKSPTNVLRPLRKLSN